MRQSEEIIVSSRRALQKRLDQLNRKARKLGLDPIEAVFIRETEMPVEQVLMVDGEVVSDFTENRPAFVYQVSSYNLDVSGWRMAAKVDYVADSEPFVQTIGGYETRLRELNDALLSRKPAECEHCHKERIRNSVYLLVNEETGELKQVGKNCAKTLLGMDDLRVAEFQSFVLQQICEDAELLGSAGRGKVDAAETRLALAAGKAIADAGEWRGKDDNYPTVQELRNSFASRSLEKKFVRDQLLWEGALLPVDWSEVDHLRDEILDMHLDSESDPFLTAIQYCLEREFVPVSKVGLVGCASIALRIRAAKEEENRRRSKQAEAGHFGEEGKRMSARLRLDRRWYVETAYGNKQYNRLTGPNGENILFRTTSDSWDYPKVRTEDEPEDFLRPGEWCEAKFTVGEHTAYEGIPQTIVKRLQVQQIIRGDEARKTSGALDSDDPENTFRRRPKSLFFRVSASVRENDMNKDFRIPGVRLPQLLSELSDQRELESRTIEETREILEQTGAGDAPEPLMILEGGDSPETMGDDWIFASRKDARDFAQRLEKLSQRVCPDYPVTTEVAEAPYLFAAKADGALGGDLQRSNGLRSGLRILPLSEDAGTSIVIGHRCYQARVEACEGVAPIRAWTKPLKAAVERVCRPPHAVFCKLNGMECLVEGTERQSFAAVVSEVGAIREALDEWEGEVGSRRLLFGAKQNWRTVDEVRTIRSRSVRV